MRDASNWGVASDRRGRMRTLAPLSLPTHLADVARHDLQLAAFSQGSHLRFNLRRHAMAVNVPPGAGVFEKPLSGFARHGAPDRLRVRPQTVNDASPVPTAQGWPTGQRTRPPAE